MWIQTYTGKKFHPFNPQKDEIDIIDIAHALSNICRYGGHCNQFYSVAQHSILVSQLVSKENAFQGLMHDAAEAYINDLPSPVKQGLWEYRLLESRLLKVIFAKFDILYPISEEVVDYDHAICLTERDVLFNDALSWGMEDKYTAPTISIRPWKSIYYTQEQFLERFKVLNGEGYREAVRVSESPHNL